MKEPSSTENLDAPATKPARDRGNHPRAVSSVRCFTDNEICWSTAQTGRPGRCRRRAVSTGESLKPARLELGAEMPELGKTAEPRSADAPALKLAADILGGPKVLKWQLKDPLDAHELLLRGLPGAALTHLVDNLVLLHDPVSLEK